MSTHYLSIQHNTKSLKQKKGYSKPWLTYKFASRQKGKYHIVVTILPNYKDIIDKTTTKTPNHEDTAKLHYNKDITKYQSTKPLLKHQRA